MVAEGISVIPRAGKYPNQFQGGWSRNIMPYLGLGDGFISHVKNWGKITKDTPPAESVVVLKTVLTAQQQ